MQPPSEDEAAFWGATPRPASSRSRDTKEEITDEETEETSAADTSPDVPVPNPSLRWSLAGRKAVQADETETDPEIRDEEENEGDGDATVILIKEPKTALPEVVPPLRRGFSLLRNPRSQYGQSTAAVPVPVPPPLPSSMVRVRSLAQQPEVSSPVVPNQQKQSKQNTIPEPSVPSEPAVMTGNVVCTEKGNNLPFPITPEIEMHVVCSLN